MLKGIYTAASGMIANINATDTMANNLANVSTTGFKKNQVSFQTFPELVLKRIHNNDSDGKIGGLSTGTGLHSTQIHFDQGNMRSTGNKLDFAVSGDGFFTLEDEDGNQFYTRNGNFTQSADGYLITQDGRYVLGEGGRIQLPYGSNAESSIISVHPNGDIVAGDTIVDRLQITQFEDNHTLVKLGDTIFRESAESKILNGVREGIKAVSTVMQGVLEGSNVSMVNEMVNSITGTRLYEALQRTIKTQDSSLEGMFNQIGRF